MTNERAGKWTVQLSGQWGVREVGQDLVMWQRGKISAQIIMVTSQGRSCLCKYAKYQGNK